MPSARERLVVIACLGGVAITHLADLPHKLLEAPYLAALFIGLISACTVLALAVVSERLGRAAVVAAGWLAVATIGGFVWSRVEGLPLIEDHVGDWSGVAGLASLVFEAGLVAVALRLAPSEDQVVADEPLELAVLEQQREQRRLQLLPQLAHLREQR